MKKFNYFLGMGILATMAMTSCSSENNNEPPFNPANADGVAYVVVSVRDADTYSRGDFGTGDDEFSYATGTEGTVGNAYFYFYDENGIFVSEATAWDGHTNTTDRPNNINFKGNNVVMLKGLTDKKSPKFVVTILNKPGDFHVAEGSTLDDMEAKLATAAGGENGGTRNGVNFIMSTTTFPTQVLREDGVNVHAGEPLPKPFVTELVQANFVDDPDGDTSATPCKIYVERLAAKVSLGFRVKANADDRTGTDLVPVDGKDGVYKMKITLAGALNEEDDSDNKAAEFVYITFGKWGLTNTAKNSFMMKNYDDAWAGLASPADFRSHWAKAWTYDDASDAKYNRLSENSLFSGAGSAMISNNFSTPLYCAENTHSGDFLNTNFNQVTTSVLLTARIYADEDLTSSVNLVRYQGVLYKESSYIKYELSALDKANDLNYFKRTGSGVAGDPYTYTQISDVDVEPKSIGSSGEIELVSKLDAATVLYARTGGSGTAEDPYTYTTKTVADLNSILHAFNASAPAYRYKEGQMYYTIPIEHVVPIDPTDTEYTEGQYGIVRNHHYKLTITKLRNLGSGVFDPAKSTDPIIPDDPQKELYQIGAEINILSWKCVYQDNIEL